MTRPHFDSTALRLPRRLCAAFCGLPLLVVPLALQAGADDRPNILWIVGENLCLDLGVYGMENVETPNLDGLAARGQRYTNVYSTFSIP